MTKNVRLIAFYLPQFHPIPENDAWWGKGFTEWSNVTKARPLFPGHEQPRLPTELGFYDLRLPDVRQAQAELARAHGIEGFCYWHYWFAGKRLLEQPFSEVLRTKKPDFPFCLAWANQTWTGIWHGAPDRILIEQTYPSDADFTAHFNALLEAFQDPRYIKIEGKPVFFVLRPHNLPDPLRFTNLWRESARKAGLSGIYFVGMGFNPAYKPAVDGFDALMFNQLFLAFARLDQTSLTIVDRICKKLTGLKTREVYNRLLSRPKIYAYKDVIRMMNQPFEIDGLQFPEVVPNWDNTPRRQARGIVVTGSTPELFRQHLRQAIARIADRPADQRVIFIKSWNEWGEGNYLEPDQKFERAYLEVIKQETDCI